MLTCIIIIADKLTRDERKLGSRLKLLLHVKLCGGTVYCYDWLSINEWLATN